MWIGVIFNFGTEDFVDSGNVKVVMYGLIGNISEGIENGTEYGVPDHWAVIPLLNPSSPVTSTSPRTRHFGQEHPEMWTLIPLLVLLSTAFGIPSYSGERKRLREIWSSGEAMEVSNFKNCHNCHYRTPWNSAVPPFFLELLRPPYRFRQDYYRFYPVQPSTTNNGHHKLPPLFKPADAIPARHPQSNKPFLLNLYEPSKYITTPSPLTTESHKVTPTEPNKYRPSGVESTTEDYTMHTTTYASTGSVSHHPEPAITTHIEDTQAPTTYEYETTIGETDGPTSGTNFEHSLSDSTSSDISSTSVTEDLSTAQDLTTYDTNSTPEKVPEESTPSPTNSEYSHTSGGISLVGEQANGVTPSSESGVNSKTPLSPKTEKRQVLPYYNSRDHYFKRFPLSWGQKIKIPPYKPVFPIGLRPGKKYMSDKSTPPVTPYTTTNAPTTSEIPTTYFTSTEASYKGGPSVIDKLVLYMNNRLVDAVEARGTLREKRSFDKTPSSVMTEYMSEALEELDEETLLDILSTLEDEYLTRASPEEVDVIEDTFDRLRISVMRAKAETGARFRVDDEWRIKRATKKQRAEGAAAILELLTSEDKYPERTDPGMYDDEEMGYDDYYYYDDEAVSDSEEEPSLLQLVSLANKHHAADIRR
ncbi:hypothetical protein AAG570_002254 [Ranatra chinensis]|uniref:Uncharacterized protein n=1 Tax=Ranatra chinensis TaxID=642074 RepID=A0ABD0Y7E4_9HEMI